MLTQEQIAELKELHAKGVIPSDSGWYIDSVSRSGLSRISDGLQHGIFAIHAETPQAHLIVAAVNALPSLLAEIEALREALDPLARQGGYFKPELPHFVQVEVPLEYLRRANTIYREVFGCDPRSAEDELAERALLPPPPKGPTDANA